MSTADQANFKVNEKQRLNTCECVCVYIYIDAPINKKIRLKQTNYPCILCLWRVLVLNGNSLQLGMSGYVCITIFSLPTRVSHISPHSKYLFLSLYHNSTSSHLAQKPLPSVLYPFLLRDLALKYTLVISLVPVPSVHSAKQLALGGGI